MGNGSEMRLIPFQTGMLCNLWGGRAEPEEPACAGRLPATLGAEQVPLGLPEGGWLCKVAGLGEGTAVPYAFGVVSQCQGSSGRLVRGEAGNCLTRRWWLGAGTCDGACEGKSMNLVWNRSASRVWPEGLEKVEAQLQ